jgi:DNA-binding transcriptional regulator YiaG
MPSTRFDEARDYTFADQALALRERARLTQRDLAALLGMSERAIQAWEAGLSYPVPAVCMVKRVTSRARVWQPAAARSASATGWRAVATVG